MYYCSEPVHCFHHTIPGNRNEPCKVSRRYLWRQSTIVLTYSTCRSRELGRLHSITNVVTASLWPRGNIHFSWPHTPQMFNRVSPGEFSTALTRAVQMASRFCRIDVSVLINSIPIGDSDICLKFSSIILPDATRIDGLVCKSHPSHYYACPLSADGQCPKWPKKIERFEWQRFNMSIRCTSLHPSVNFPFW